MSETYKFFLTDKYIKPTRLTYKYMRNLRLRIVCCYGYGKIVTINYTWDQGVINDKVKLFRAK